MSSLPFKRDVLDALRSKFYPLTFGTLASTPLADGRVPFLPDFDGPPSAAWIFAHLTGYEEDPQRWDLRAALANKRRTRELQSQLHPDRHKQFPVHRNLVVVSGGKMIPDCCQWFQEYIRVTELMQKAVCDDKEEKEKRSRAPATAMDPRLNQLYHVCLLFGIMCS